MFETKKELKREISRMNDRLTTERNLYNGSREQYDQLFDMLQYKNNKIEGLECDLSGAMNLTKRCIALTIV